jgi:cytochrome c oxidase cbb3-type subunit III
MSESEKDRILEHGFDGIREYDNKLPNWWLYILYASIVFAVGYWIVFQTLGLANLPLARYRIEMAKAAEAQLAKMKGQPVTNESLLLMAAVPERVAEGSAIFTQYCVVCHNANGQGNVGPNLTDNYWLHGGRPLDILNTITKGVPEKGMVAWGGQLGPARVEKVATFVISLRGKNLPGKAPQGTLESYEDKVTGAATPAAAPAPEGAKTS